MELFADRFVLVGDNMAVDLATGAPVALTIAPAGDAHAQERWVLACDAASRRHHPASPRLIDFGPVGASHRFEARILPDGRSTASLRDAPSIAIVPRPAAAAIGELFGRPSDRRPRSVAIWGPHGAGKQTIVAELARTARRNGFVPVAASLLDRFSETVRDRSLFVIGGEHGGPGWTAWLKAAIDSPRAHVLLTVALEEPWTTDAVAVEPLSSEALVGAVRPATTAAGAAALDRIARESRGWPGRFARLLWRIPELDRGPRIATGALRAAEQPAVYGVEASAETSIHGGGNSAPGDAAVWRGRLDTANQLAADGRHVAGERAFRQAIGALTRRSDWAAAGRGGLALAALLLRRGRPRDAQEALKAASDMWQRAGDQGSLIDVAVASGVASIELARLDEAETTLAAAVAAARSLDDTIRTRRALRALARSLFWSAKYDEADVTVKALPVPIDDRDLVAAADLEVAIAVGKGDLRQAVARATEVLMEAERSGDARQRAIAGCRAAFAHLAVGDIPAVDRDVAASTAAARVCREPLVAARSRLILAEVHRRAGRQGAAAAIVARLGRVGSGRLPPIVRARWELVRDLMTPARDAADVVRRHVASTGLGALALYAPPSTSPQKGHGPWDPAIAGVVDILHLCQASEDEPGLLTEVCRRVRGQLHAVAAAVVVDGQGARTSMASDGGRIDVTSADRAIVSGVTMAPHRCGDRLEAAVPVRYGGATIGALVVRWTVGTPYDLGPAAPLMTAVAVAIAPIVSAAIARARRSAAAVMTDLLGSSAAMADVRRGVERAAAAPFAVLIEGESGTGKELVARALHRSGPRRHRIFCTLNCAALPDDLVEAELFGYARGAFTGAMTERTGVFEEAHGGTLLLDEIGELSPRAQAKVLRVIQEGELRRVGENLARRIDVRIVSATNRNLRDEVAAGRFRLDLLYRLDVVRLNVPPLRDRREDIPALAEHFWREAAARVGSRATLSAAAVAALVRYDWPGNVRELQNALASLAVRSARRGIVAPAALGPPFTDQRLDDAMRLEDARRTFEERFVRAALVRTGGHRARAAAELGVSRQGLTKLMMRLRIT